VRWWPFEPNNADIRPSEKLLDRVPEAERSVTDREVGRDLESTPPTPRYAAVGQYACRVSSAAHIGMPREVGLSAVEGNDVIGTALARKRRGEVTP
jgi:hypothetical protein